MLLIYADIQDDLSWTFILKKKKKNEKKKKFWLCYLQHLVKCTQNTFGFWPLFFDLIPQKAHGLFSHFKEVIGFPNIWRYASKGDHSLDFTISYRSTQCLTKKCFLFYFLYHVWRAGFRTDQWSNIWYCTRKTLNLKRFA